MNDGTRRWAISIRFVSTIGTCSWMLALAACSGDNNGSPGKASPDGSTATDASPGPDGGAAMDGTAAEAETSAPEGGADGGASMEGSAADASDGGAVTTATLFLADQLQGLFYRYTIDPGADPVLNDTTLVPADSGAPPGTEGMAMSPAGELFVGNFTYSSGGGDILRFLSPLATPVANGIIRGAAVGVTYAEQMQFVDDELWVPNTTAACSTNPSPIVRIAFDAQGNASVAGTVTTNAIGADRGMLWVPSTRDLFESQCTPVDTIQHYRVAMDHSVTALPSITGNGLNNPHGMAMTPWGELLVNNANTNEVLRFKLDGKGNATANGSIQGNGLATPIGMSLTPWGELLVESDGPPTLSRFNFDGAHAASSNGSYVFPGVPTRSLVWSLVVPGASTTIDAGTSDAAGE